MTCSQVLITRNVEDPIHKYDRTKKKTFGKGSVHFHVNVVEVCDFEIII